MDRPCRSKGHSSSDPETRARASRIGWGLSFSSVHRWISNFQIRDICGFICKPIYGDMIYGTHAVYDWYLWLNLFWHYTLIIVSNDLFLNVSSILWLLSSNKNHIIVYTTSLYTTLSMFGYYKGKPYPRLRCIVWWDLGLIIASFFEKALRCLPYALVFLVGNPFRVIRRGPLNYSLLK